MGDLILPSDFKGRSRAYTKVKELPVAELTPEDVVTLQALAIEIQERDALHRATIAHYMAPEKDPAWAARL